MCMDAIPALCQYLRKPASGLTRTNLRPQVKWLNGVISEITAFEYAISWLLLIQSFSLCGC